MLLIQLFLLQYFVFNYYIDIVISNSMEPTIATGAVCLTKRITTADVQTGDIITFYHNKDVVIHRVVKIENSGNNIVITTKGDNNTSNDPGIVTGLNIRSKVVGVSRVLNYERIQKYKVIVFTAIVLIVGLFEVILDLIINKFLEIIFKKLRLEPKEEHSNISD